ncbi:MAG: SET domain-containing protein, partial [Gemmatimonadaceae bacterium]
TRRTVIDAAVAGNDARFINHSCEPNCEAVDENGRIFIEALRAIRRGEELSYDYAYERDRETTDEDEALYACRCGARRCRGTILTAPPARLPGVHHAASRHAARQRRRRRT